MLLPNRHLARVDRSKIVDYLLSRAHPHGCSKAAFFLRLGFTVAEWHLLADGLVRVGTSNHVASVVPSLHGVRYTVDGNLECPDGRKPRVRTVWIVELQKHAPRLVTSHPR